LREYLAGEVAEDYGAGFVSRREALRRLGLLGVGLSSATALLAACSGDDDDAASGSKESPKTSAEGSSSESTAATTPPTTGAPVTAKPVTFTSSVGQLQAASAIPAQPKGAVLVVHENRGLTPEFYDFVAGRTAGYAVSASISSQ
jgi:carboxymethylenebutenolidase